MGYSKMWLALTTEERKIKRKEYNDKYKAKYPDKVKEQYKKYREKNKVDIRKKSSAWQKEKCRNNKIKAIEYLGGKCIDCNNCYLPSVYDFHHLDTTIKENNIARIMGRKWENIVPELDKCVLLCANCHRIRHNND